jgi:dTDP-4-dehydrorhamnose 3,5-epimerase
MLFKKLPLSGAYLIFLEPRQDERGIFSRIFCAQEFAARSLETHFVQANMSTNMRAGTVRGMHFQQRPHGEVKVVRCIRGAVFDVIIDVRKKSPTFGHFYSAELTVENGAAMYVPIGFAHGYQALTDGATVHYTVSAFYAPEYEDGIRYSDTSVGIPWPLPIADVSSKDAKLPFLDQSRGFDDGE